MVKYARKNSVLDAAAQPDDGHIGEIRATAIGSRKIHDKPTQIDIPHAFIDLRAVAFAHALARQCQLA